MAAPRQLFTNNAKGRLNAGIAAAATSCALGAGQGALFPNPSGSDWFIGTFIKSTGAIEIFKCTARTGDSLTTIVRGQEGTAPLDLDANDRVELRATAGGLQYLEARSHGKFSIPISAVSINGRSTNGCGSLGLANGAADQPDVPYLPFDGAAKEYAGFLMQMPKSWDRGTITAKFAWRRASGAGVANVVWGIRAVALSDNNSPAVNFGTDATVTDDAKTTTANFALSAETGPCTVGNVPSESDLVFFEVFRDGAAVADTLDGVDAWLTAVTLFITTEAATDD
jgi:hypothetical protein